MRLINTDTLELSEFIGSDIPTYAILSHTWTKEEVTLREWTHPSDATTSKAGYRKICRACSLARRHGHAWIWVDTNCIDKTSSAELSEAINSMFEWYRAAAVCFVYFEDVTKDSLAEAGADPETADASTRRSVISQFCASRWFTRGWTLQELLAPQALSFYSREWAYLGTKQDFISEIIATTGIEETYLCLPELSGDRPSFLRASTATRMSWAAKRQTTRVEDMAYCLLGLFDINMPLLYGEGLKAFFRLQEEIIRRYDDHTIFAWGENLKLPRLLGSLRTTGIGVLAPTPQAFVGATHLSNRTVFFDRSAYPYSLTNCGISISLPVMRTRCGFIAALNVAESTGHYRAGLWLVTAKREYFTDERARSARDIVSRSTEVLRPFRLCPMFDLGIHDHSDLLLRPGDWRLTSVVTVSTQTQPELPRTHGSSSRYGLMLGFDASAWRTNPPPLEICLLGNLKAESDTDILAFPTMEEAPEAWFTTVYPSKASPKTAEADSHQSPLRFPIHVHTTGAVIGMPDAFENAIDGLVRILTVSIVQRGEGEGTRSYPIFAHRDCGPFGMSQFSLRRVTRSWSRYWDKLDKEKILKEVVQEESARIVDSCTMHDRGKGIPKICYPLIKMGCCDMGHPDFDELRLVYIKRNA